MDDWNRKLKVKRANDALWARFDLKDAGKGPNTECGRGCNIHPSAVIDPGARIGGNVTIGANARIDARAVLRDGARVGEGAEIGKDAILDKNAAVERNAKIGEHAFVGQDSTVRAHAQVGAATFLDKNSEIGERSRTTVGVQVGADSKLGRDVELGLHTRVGDATQVGEGVKTGRHCEIGELAGEKSNGLMWYEAQRHIKTGVAEYEKENGTRYEGKEPRPTVVDAGTSLGEACSIGQGAYVGRECEIRDHGAIGRDATVGDQVRLERVAAVGHDARVGSRTALDEKAVIGCNAKVPRETTLGKHDEVPNHGNETQVSNPTQAAKDTATQEKAAKRQQEYLEENNALERGAATVLNAIAAGATRVGKAITNAAQRLTGRTKPEAPREPTATERFVENRGNLQRLDPQASLKQTHARRLEQHETRAAAQERAAQPEIGSEKSRSTPAGQSRTGATAERSAGRTESREAPDKRPETATDKEREGAAPRDGGAKRSEQAPPPTAPNNDLQKIVAQHKDRGHRPDTDSPPSEPGQDAGGRAAARAGTAGNGERSGGASDLQRLVRRHQQDKAPAAPKVNELQALLAKNRDRTAKTGQPATARATPRIGEAAPAPATAPGPATGSAQKVGQARANPQQRV